MRGGPERSLRQYMLGGSGEQVSDESTRGDARGMEVRTLPSMPIRIAVREFMAPKLQRRMVLYGDVAALR